MFNAKKFNAFQLKTLALVFMIIDHLHTYLNLGPSWISIVTRFVAPLFTFFIVEGFFKTSSRKNYLKRTSLFALIMLAGNVLINLILGSTDPLTGKVSFYSLVEGNNIFMTFAVFIVLLSLLENIKNKQNTKRSIALFVLLSILSILFTEGGAELYIVLLIMYYFYQDNKKISLAILILSLLRLFIALFKYYSGSTGAGFIASMSFNSSWAMILVIIPILLYNNERGRNDSFAKWLFYIIYPVHIWILKIIAVLYIYNY